jgi:hypothetical protein
MAKNVVPVYSRNATSSRETPLYYLSQKEAMALIENGQAKRVSRLKAPLKVQMLNLVIPDVNSPCSISFNEMEANAGLTGTKGYIRRVQEKIAAWNTVGEGRLVCH